MAMPYSRTYTYTHEHTECLYKLREYITNFGNSVKDEIQRRSQRAHTQSMQNIQRKI